MIFILQVEEKPWYKSPRKIHQNKIVPIKINYGEVALRRLVREAGGKWNKQKKVWELVYKSVIELGLEKRIVND